MIQVINKDIFKDILFEKNVIRVFLFQNEFKTSQIYFLIINIFEYPYLFIL